MSCLQVMNVCTSFLLNFLSMILKKRNVILTQGAHPYAVMNKTIKLPVIYKCMKSQVCFTGSLSIFYHRCQWFLYLIEQLTHTVKSDNRSHFHVFNHVGVMQKYNWMKICGKQRSSYMRSFTFSISCYYDSCSLCTSFAPCFQFRIKKML